MTLVIPNSILAFSFFSGDRHPGFPKALDAFAVAMNENSQAHKPQTGTFAVCCPNAQKSQPLFAL